MLNKFKLGFMLIILFGLISTSGCWGSKEIDEAAYVLALGIDAGPGHNLTISTLIENPGIITSMGENKRSLTAAEVRVFTAQAPTIFSGFNIINTILENQLEFSHTKMVIFGETLARRDIEPYFDTLTRWRKFRRTFYIAVAQGDARRVIESIIPPAGYNSAKYIETMFTSQAYVGYTPDNQMFRFYNALKTKGEEPVATLVSPRISKYDLTTTKETRIDSGTIDSKTDTGDPGEYTAGHPPLSGDASLQFLGTAVFQNGKMVENLTGNETIALKILRGELSRTFISVPDPKDSGKLMEVELSQISYPQIKVIREKDGFQAKVLLNMFVNIVGLQSNQPYESPQNIPNISEAIGKWIKAQCFEVFRKAQAVGSDIFGFGNYARWLAPDWPTWRKWDWNSSFKTLTLDLTVKAKIDQTGLIIKKNAVQGD